LTAVSQVIPELRAVDLESVLDGVAAAPVVPPFHASRRDFVTDLARRLGRRSAAHPESRALAYWMRKAEVTRMEAAFAELGTDDIVLQPRGTVFHIPPANVDTIFVYSWAMSTLLGNRNIVRMSSRATDQSNLILEVIREVLIDHPEVARSTSMLTYGHEDAITAAISRVSDTRVIWGGDATVNRIRAVALPPHATELTFTDRFSFAAISAPAYLALDEAGRDALVERFFNDAYFFDQMGCSSARLLIWVGASDEASSDFRQRLRSMVRTKGYDVPTSAAIAKIGQAYRGMIDADAVAVDSRDNALTVLDVERFPHVRGEFCGGGFLYELPVERLADIAEDIRRADQTLAVFGIPQADLRDFVGRLTGRGVDRIVPIGKALEFSRYWDGYDLFTEFTRKVTIDSGGVS